MWYAVVFFVLIFLVCEWAEWQMRKPRYRELSQADLMWLFSRRKDGR